MANAGHALLAYAEFPQNERGHTVDAGRRHLSQFLDNIRFDRGKHAALKSDQIVRAHPLANEARKVDDVIALIPTVYVINLSDQHAFPNNES